MGGGTALYQQVTGILRTCRLVDLGIICRPLICGPIYFSGILQDNENFQVFKLTTYGANLSALFLLVFLVFFWTVFSDMRGCGHWFVFDFSLVSVVGVVALRCCRLSASTHRLLSSFSVVVFVVVRNIFRKISFRKVRQYINRVTIGGSY